MNLKQLSCFVQVADAGSFSKAALLLNVDQSALSRNVRLLEVELRQNLFTRNGRGVALTEAGRHWASHCRGILQQLDRAREELEERRGAPVGHVVVGVTPSVGICLTARLVGEFRKQNAAASIGVIEGLSGALLKGLNTGRIDIGFIHNPQASPQLEIKGLIETSLYMIGPSKPMRKVVKRGEPIPLAAVAQHELILAGRPNALRALIDTTMAEAGLRPKAVLEVEGLHAVLNLVASGHGCSILPFGPASAAICKHTLSCRPIIEPRITTKLALVVSARRPVTQIIASTITLMQTLVMELDSDSTRPSATRRIRVV